MKKTVVLAIIFIMILSSLQAIAQETPASDQGTGKITATQDNIGDIKPDQVPNIDPASLTQDVLHKMSDEQLSKLTAGQMNENVLLILSGAPDGTRLGSVNPNEVQIAFNRLYSEGKGGMSIEAVRTPSNYDNVRIVQETGERTFIQDSNGNMFDVSSKAKIYVDSSGIIHLIEGDDVKIKTKEGKGPEITVSGPSSLEKDGTVVCEKACTVNGDDITVKMGENTIHFKGKVSFDSGGNIVEARGNLLESYDEDSPLMLGNDKAMHYEVEAESGTKIDWSQDENLKVTFAGGDGGEISYYEGEINRAYMIGTEGSTAEMKGSSYASFTGCNIVVSGLHCSYQNYDRNKMNGFDLPRGGYLYLQTGKDGSFSFDSGVVQLRGQDTELSIHDREDNIFMGTENIDAGNTKIILGKYDINDKGIETSTCLDDACKEKGNLVLFKSTTNAEFYTQDFHKVEILLNHGDGASQTRLTTTAGGVSGSFSLKGADEAAYPEISINQWKSMPMGAGSGIESLAKVTFVDHPGVEGEEVIREDAIKVGRDAAGNIKIYTNLDNSDHNKYVVHTTNPEDEKKGEILYSNGENSVLVGVNDGKYDLRAIKSGLEASIDDNEKKIVVDVLSQMGMATSDIANLERFGNKVFSEQERNNLIDHGTLTGTAAPKPAGQAQPEAKTPAETPKPGTDQGNVEKTPAEQTPATTETTAAPDRRQVLIDTNPASITPGPINGGYLTNDPDVNALIRNLGYGSVRDFQSAAGIKVDGIVGAQTSAALMRACYQAPDKCNKENLNGFETRTSSAIDSSVQQTRSSPGSAKIQESQPNGGSGDGAGRSTTSTSSASSTTPKKCSRGYHLSTSGKCIRNKATTTSTSNPASSSPKTTPSASESGLPTPQQKTTPPASAPGSNDLPTPQPKSTTTASGGSNNIPTPQPKTTTPSSAPGSNNLPTPQ